MPVSADRHPNDRPSLSRLPGYHAIDTSVRRQGETTEKAGLFPVARSTASPGYRVNAGINAGGGKGWCVR